MVKQNKEQTLLDSALLIEKWNVQVVFKKHVIKMNSLFSGYVPSRANKIKEIFQDAIKQSWEDGFLFAINKIKEVSE